VGRLLTARSSIARDRSAALAARLRSQPAGTLTRCSAAAATARALLFAALQSISSAFATKK